jgi:hypothetical protein
MHPSYNQVFYGLPLLCELVEGFLLWRLVCQDAFTRYPYLGAYICYDLVRTPSLLAVAYVGLRGFPLVYGITNVPALLLQFCILWEVARSLFRPNSPLRRMAWKGFLVAQTLMVVAVIVVSWSQASLVRFPASSAAAGFEQYSSLSQAVLLFLVAAFARYYGISFGRNMRGLIFSLGPYLLLNSVSFATYQIFGALRRYLELLPATAYTGMIAVWLYSFWQYAPSPEQASLSPISKQQWNDLWETTLSLVRHRSS